MHTNKDGVVTPSQTTACGNALFAHVRWHTKDHAPLLSHDEVAQAAHNAIAARARELRCRALVIGGTAALVNVVFSFPDSVPLSTLTRQVMCASGTAVARFLSLTNGSSVAAESIWDRSYAMQTLNPREAADVTAYVRQHHADEGNLADWGINEASMEMTYKLPLCYLIREPS